MQQVRAAGFQTLESVVWRRAANRSLHCLVVLGSSRFVIKFSEVNLDKQLFLAVWITFLDKKNDRPLVAIHLIEKPAIIPLCDD
jgi:hypothetical protein